MTQKSFLFYLNWEQQVDLMKDDELRRFIKNLCRFARGEDVELTSREEQLCWLGIVPALEINKVKYDKKSEANRENGKYGGAPKGNQNASKTKTTENNPNNPIIDKSKMINDKSKKESDNRKNTNDNWQQETGKSQLEKENWQDENENRQEINDNSKRIPEITGASNTGGNTVDVISFNNLISNKPDLPYNLSRKEHKEVLDEIFDRYPSWEQELTKSNNLNGFLNKYKNYLKQEARKGVESYGDTEDNIFNWYNEFITSYYNR
jgi:hypothetical protein